MPNVSVDDVRDAINVSSADIPDNKVLKMIKRAEVTLELRAELEACRATRLEGSRGQGAWTKAEELWLKFEKTCIEKSESWLC